MKIIIATTKVWNVKNAENFSNKNRECEIYIINNNKELNLNVIEQISPDYIFFPHWSWMIPNEICIRYNCIVFHMTDLPFGRGGSPLQNLINFGIENTKITALKADNGIDTGDVYLKKDLNLNGSAEEIYLRASKIVFDEMIPEIIKNKISPKKQEGKVLEFKRRHYADGEIFEQFELEKIFDYIRMLDAVGYPKAFIKFGEYKLEFSRASLKGGKIIADVEIIGSEEW